MVNKDGHGGTFTPEMVELINTAYERALDLLDIQMAHSDRRAALARCVLDTAKNGETDADRLLGRAVDQMRRNDRIRERAHTIWEAQGRPSHRSEEHWRQSEADIAAEDARNGSIPPDDSASALPG